MFYYRFEWDPAKAASNNGKHGVDFETAATVFHDLLTLTIPDAEHSSDEERWVTLGQTHNGQLLVVAHTFNESGANAATIRIISARPATKREQHQYEEATR